MSGNRNNAGKAKISLVLDAGHAVRGLSKVLEFGAATYGRGNWKQGLKWTEVADSMMRHLLAFNSGEDIDPDSGLPHVDHVLANALFLSEFFHSDVGEDDRSIPTDRLTPTESGQSEASGPHQVAQMPLRGFELRDLAERLGRSPTSKPQE